MSEPRTVEFAGIRALEVGSGSRTIVVLHGRSMSGRELAPFAASTGAAGRYFFPDAPFSAYPRGRTWWPADEEARARGLVGGPVDYHLMDPRGRAEARDRLALFLGKAIVGQSREMVLVGFSQGGMLAMDYALHAPRQPSHLALLSTSRMAFASWQPLLYRLAGMPVYITHGRQDQVIPFSAGLALRDAALAGQAQVTWTPFEGGHEVPLGVWRGLGRFLGG